MINLEKLGLSSEEVLQRSQMKEIIGGGYWVCSCSSGGGQFLVMAQDTEEALQTANAECQGAGASCSGH